MRSIVGLPPETALRALLRFLAGALLLGSLAAGFEERPLRAALPLFRAWLDLVDSTYRTVELSIVQSGDQTIVQRTATPARPHAVGEKVVYNDPRTRIVSSAAAGMVLLVPVLAGALVFAWPWRSAMELVVRLAAAAPSVLLVVLLDVPLTLYGAAWYREVALADPGGFSPLVTWVDFMNAGGRFALTIVAAAIAVRLGAGLTSSRSAAPRKGGAQTSAVAGPQ